MATKQTLEAPTIKDMACTLGGNRGTHWFMYIRGDQATGQEPVYKCNYCSLVLTKASLKKITDGGN